MTERPILFSGPMVRALLAGTKTQTRRVVKSDIEIAAVGGGADWGRAKAHPAMGTPRLVLLDCNGHPFSLRCPYGQPGDRLWVREAFADLTETHGQRWERFNEETRLYERGTHRFLWYRADGDQPDVGDGALNPERWRPSIHMPRWASRITLEITGVRVERLQDISEADAIAEGIEKTAHGFWSTYGQFSVDGTYSPAVSYHSLWQSINGAEGPTSWTGNPFVWVVEFKRVTPAVSQQEQGE